MKLFYINAKSAAGRVPYILSRKGPLLIGLNDLAAAVRKGLKPSEVTELQLDFISGKAAFEILIPEGICSELKKHQVRELIVKISSGKSKPNPLELPDKELRVAIKCALRELATRGMPRKPIKIDLSSSRGREKRHGFEINVKTVAIATLSRSSTWSAALDFSYRTGSIPISLIKIGRGLDE